MSKNPDNGKKDFESLYNDLKEEYEQSKKDNDEICKEYESTIQILTDSVESFKKEKKELQSKLSQIENDQKAYKREKENLIKKNKDKIIDIKCLNEQNEKLNELIKKLKEEKSLFDTKVVTLENDIDHYQNKVREYEDFIDELKTQLEDALEENITLQTEFETYKLNMGDQLIKKEEELKDIKTDITNKDRIIQRLTKKPSERLDIQKIQEKLMNDKKIIGSRRRYTLVKNIYDSYSKKQNNLPNIEESDNENIRESNKNLDIFLENNNKINRNYKKAFTICRTSQKYLEQNDNSNSTNKDNNKKEKKSDKNIKKTLNYNEAENKQNDNKEKKNLNKNENKMNGLSAIIKRQFGELIICEENNIYINPLVHNLFTEEQIKEFTMALQSMLIRIQQRKNNLYNKKKAINEQLEKIGFRKR